MKQRLAFALAAFLATSTPALAYDWSATGKVTSIEASASPSYLWFTFDQQAGICPTGQTLYWLAKGPDATTQYQNVQATLAVLLTAKTTGQQVTLFGDNADCNIQYIHIV